MQQHVFTISSLCKALGIEHAIICPGSRSAPLVFAFGQSGIHCHSVVDERSAAYMALGMAQQTGRPVVLICTSGTAALNFFPAIAEAFYQKIPLLVLTADRPPELLNQQDGQMVQQSGVYGGHVRASFDLPCYPHGKENLSETANLVKKAIDLCLAPVKGPVHINVPLSEPLYPKQLPAKGKLASGALPEQMLKALSKTDAHKASQLWDAAKQKMVLVGQLPPDGSLTAALIELSKHPDVTIVCDVLSNQYQFNTAPQFDYILMRADQDVKRNLEPDCLISLGGPVLSKSLKLWLQQARPATHIRFDAPGEQVDTYRNVTHRMEGNPVPWLFACGLSKPVAESTYALLWQAANKVIWEPAERFAKSADWNELTALHQVLNAIPDAANVQVGNSSVIRYVSYLGCINPSWVMNGNRGTSGIDGCTSTAVGAAMVNNRPTYLLTGDVAFLYDINALWNEVPPNLKIIIVNNEGGGIFQLIDGPSTHKQALHYFTTPHKQSLRQIALQKGVQYYLCQSVNDIKQSRAFFAPGTGPAILEVKVDRDSNAALFKQFKNILL